MAIELSKKELIAHAVIKVLFSRFVMFPEDGNNNRNAPFHMSFLNAFREKLDNRVSNIPTFIGLSSWMHGLNTALGQSFFESVAHILCDGEKRTFAKKFIYTNQVSAISDIMIGLKNGTQKPCVCSENRIIASNAYGDAQEASNFTVDCMFITDEAFVAIELKSVRPNSGEVRGKNKKSFSRKPFFSNCIRIKRLNTSSGSRLIRRQILIPDMIKTGSFSIWLRLKNFVRRKKFL